MATIIVLCKPDIDAAIDPYEREIRSTLGTPLGSAHVAAKPYVMDSEGVAGG